MLNPAIAEQKLLKTLSLISNSDVLSNVDIERVFYLDDVKDKNKLPVYEKGWKEFKKPRVLFKQDKFYWFKAEFDIKRKSTNELVYFSVDPHIYGPASTIRPQGLLYINGEAVQGLDINHTDVLLDDGHYEVYILFYTHTFGERLNLDFTIKTKDKRTNKAYFDFDVAIDTLRLLKQDDENYLKMLPVVLEATNLIDFRSIRSKEYYDSILKACEFLDKNFYNGICGSDKTVNVVGHSHIDVAWLWDLEQTRQKAKRTFSTVLKLMDQYPEYKFMASTPQLYEFVKEDDPVLYSKIKEKIKEGRWEVDGATWLECDTNLVSGESLVRQVMFGKRFFKQEFGVDSKTLWLPDVFGYSGALPQILVKSGIERFVTAKIGWNDTNRFPYDTFKWTGIDGTEVSTFLISTPELCAPRQGIYDSTYTTYCPNVDAHYILGTWNRYQQKELNKTVFMTMGYGDGGGGVTAEMLERELRFRHGLPGLPKTKLSTLKETLDEIEKTVYKNAKKLGTNLNWNGEMYLEFHRGTYTSVPEIKYNNRKAEFLMHNVELYSTMSKKLLNTDYNKELINKNWKTILLNQFHDIIPGSSIGKVYEDSRKQFKGLFDEVGKLNNEEINLLAKNVKGKGLLVFNPNSFEVNGNVKTKNGTVVVKNIPSFGYKIVNEHANDELKITDLSLENNLYKVEFNKKGQIISFIDKTSNRELVKHGEVFNKLVAFEDTPYEYDNWEISPLYYQKPYELNEDASFKQIKDGDRVGLEITHKYMSSKIVQTFFIYKELERIDVENHIEWHEKNQLLKVMFPLNINNDKVRYDIQFGSLECDPHSKDPFESAKFEHVAHKFVDISEKDYGFALLNDCKYGHGIVDNVLSLTLLKSGSFPFDGASNIIPDFIYSFVPHNGAFNKSKVNEIAYVLNNPLEVIEINNEKGILPSEYSFVKCSTPGVIIETVKKAEDRNEIVLRLYESFKEEKMVEIEFGFNVRSVDVLNLLENKKESLKVEDNKVEFKIKPFEIVTLGVK